MHEKTLNLSQIHAYENYIYFVLRIVYEYNMELEGIFCFSIKKTSNKACFLIGIRKLSEIGGRRTSSGNMITIYEFQAHALKTC